MGGPVGTLEDDGKTLLFRSTPAGVGSMPEKRLKPSASRGNLHIETSRLRPTKAITKDSDEETRDSVIARVRAICDRLGLDRGWVSAQIKKFALKQTCAVCNRMFATCTSTKTINGRAAHVATHPAFILLIDRPNDGTAGETNKPRYNCGFCGEELVDEKSMNFHAYLHLTMVDLETAETSRSRSEMVRWRFAVDRRISVPLPSRDPDWRKP